jgi:hypothetical protein
MRTLARISAAAALCLCAVAPATASAATAAPAWNLTLTPVTTNFAPGARAEYLVLATNVGAKPAAGESKVEVDLPEGVAPIAGKSFISNSDPASAGPQPCTVAAQAVSCKTSEAVGPGRYLIARVELLVGAVEPQLEPLTLTAKASVSGGGASRDVATEFATQVQKGPVPFDFLSGFKAPLSDEGGDPQTLAGSHPYQQTVDFGFPTEEPGDGITNDGHARNFSVELPRGLVGDPAATPVLCTELELLSEGCPRDSQVGLADVTTLLGEATVGSTAPLTSNLFNMVPPPGVAAELATNVANAGIFSHILAGVRSDGDYGIEAATHDVLAFGKQPIFNIQAQLWGDPSAEGHDSIRGAKCLKEGGSCPAEEKAKTAFLTMPGSCSGSPSLFHVRADTWEQPGSEHETTYESAELPGAPVALEECGTLEFEPTIEVHSTTNVSDSPSGLDFRLHQPQEVPHEEPLGGQATATVKDIAVTLPAGMTVNPSQAAGLGVCTEAQIGFEEKTAAGRLDFSKQPQSCPDAAKIGTLEAASPLLVARNAKHEVEEDIEGHPVLEPLHGTVYLAKPFANPLGSLVAIYLVVEDEKTGILAKIAAEGRLDPQTGQITTYLRENPELPLEDVRVHLFGGSRGALITPPACAPEGFTTEADLTPWSAPEGKDAFPQASFKTTAAPRGGPCPAGDAQLPNAFKFTAGTQTPAAGAFSPLLFKISREDGTQRFGRIEATLPKGLSAKLAGVGICSEADIAKARSREEPEEGALEQADPSCPASSQVGTVIGSAGAGPHPYYTSGRAYLAGPYKGAPLSVVAIVPAVAGPFDLGSVVNRSALYLDPETAQARIVSDPLPSVLHGVALDVRSVAVRADRPDFALNPTSCSEKSFGGQEVSTLGQAAPLFQRFQVGGCSSLPYKPKLTASLYGPTTRGGHPRLRTVFTARPGDANTSRISFALPKSEFIDQAHFRTICTRVQFAADQCPAGAVYGYVKATSPLADYPVEGPIYLRSSAHKLPDLVIALKGPAYQPIEVDLDGRVDSVNGGIRATFEAVPDLPVAKAIVSMQGGRKGLFQNSTDICKGTHRATLKLDAQNGKVADSRPKLRVKCKGKNKKQPKKGHR